MQWFVFEIDLPNKPFSIAGTVLFAVTGGAETPVKKVYMIDARTGDILTSFDSNPVGTLLFLIPAHTLSLFSAFNCPT